MINHRVPHIAILPKTMVILRLGLMDKNKNNTKQIELLIVKIDPYMKKLKQINLDKKECIEEFL